VEPDALGDEAPGDPPVDDGCPPEAEGLPEAGWPPDGDCWPPEVDGLPVEGWPPEGDDVLGGCGDGGCGIEVESLVVMQPPAASAAIATHPT
jgi:hypothetical protein